MSAKWYRLIVICISFLAFTGALAQSADDPIDPSGRPMNLIDGKTTGFGVWEEKGTWFIRSTAAQVNGKSQRVLFQGRVALKGDKFVNGNFEGLVKSKTNPEWVRMSKDQTTFDFQFSTASSNPDGVSFTVGPNTESITFSVLIAGRETPNAIMIGSKSVNPNKAIFTIPVTPPKTSPKN
jgi:hypothetical protein